MVSGKRLEFSLGQGWARGLCFAFENAHDSKSIELNDCAFLKQVHGRRIYEPTFNDWQSESAIAEADGILLTEGEIKSAPKKIAIFTADCVPLVYVDHQSKAVALVHAGWRGLQQSIHTKLFDEKFMDPKTTWVWLGPSLNGETFEVGEDMWKQFPKATREDLSIFLPRENDASVAKWSFFPWKMIECDFKKYEVELLYNVEVNTFLDKDFASFRRAQLNNENSRMRNITWLSYLEPSPI